MGRIIINCDLGENEPAAQTRELLSLVDAANIGCGVHAGSQSKTRSTIKIAREHGVLIGAHPGIQSAGGRGGEFPSSEAFAELLERQWAFFCEAAAEAGTTPDYVKLHGSLYHAVESQAGLAESYLHFLSRAGKTGKGVTVFSLAGGSFADRAQSAGLRVYREAFADRAYRSDGRLVPRGQAGAVLSADAALDRLRAWCETGKMATGEDGGGVAVAADTLCVHGDSPDAIPLLKKIRELDASFS